MFPFKLCACLFPIINNKVTKEFQNFLPYPLLPMRLPPSPPHDCTVVSVGDSMCCHSPALGSPNCVWLLALKLNLIYSQMPMPFYRTVKKEAHGFWQERTAPTWPSTVFAVDCQDCRHCASRLRVKRSPICGDNFANVKVTCKAFCTICVAFFPHSFFNIRIHVQVVNYDY